MNIKLKAAIFTFSMLAASYLSFIAADYFLANVTLTADEFRKGVVVVAIGFLTLLMYNLVLARLRMEEGYEKIQENRE
jgi:hypothetical protein